MATRGRPGGAAGRAPRAGRSGASTRRRSRAALPARTPPRDSTRPARATLTARAAVLAVALASVALAVALPFKVWVGQRGQIHTLETQTRQQQQHIAALREEQKRWKDPDYIKQQARLRLHYAMPGETTYVVLDKPKPRKTAPAAKSEATKLTGPWYARLWQSVQAAGTATDTS